MELSELGLNNWLADQASALSPPGESLARVTAVDRDRYLIHNERGEMPAELKGRLVYVSESRSDLPCVGDWVTALSQLHIDIDTRVQTIRGIRPDWPCGKGCDSCCRRLAEVPQLNEAEWILLQEGLVALPRECLRTVSRDMAVLSGQLSRPIVCPLLDQSTGACMVYAQRPVACRTYGFYVQRELGLYCQDIESRVADGDLAHVVWGNHDAIEHRLGGLGENLALTEWFQHWENEK